MRLEEQEGMLIIKAKERGVAGDDEALASLPLPQEHLAMFAAVQAKLADKAKNPDFLRHVEQKLLALCDPLLQAAGWTPGSQNPADTDASRRAAAQVCLRRLQEHLAALSEVPKTVNPVTLAELELPEELRQIMAESLHGGTISGYQSRGQNEYTLYARARDSAGTKFELTEAGSRMLSDPETIGTGGFKMQSGGD